MMATVGDQLTAPESGWKRYDDAEPFISYTGFTQRNHAVTGAYEGKSSYNANGSAVGEVIFSFVGTKVRIISSTTNTSRAESVSVSIDGNVETFTARTNANQAQTLVYEKQNLPYSTHTVKIFDFKGVLIGSSAAAFGLDAIDIDSDGRLVRPIGTQLTTPDEGWRRYDDSVSSIKYVGNFTNGVGAGAYNGYSNYTSTIGDKIVFDFEGTQVRLVGARYTNRSDLIEVYVDGKLHGTHSQLGSELAQVLLVDIVGLPKARHRIEMVNKSNGSSTTFMALDAIDIDLDGRFFHPDEVTSITELEIGKRIRCNYVVNTAGVAGEFKNIGEETSEFISRTSIPSVPNGDFYFIVADKYNKKKILIADRPIQAAISWDAINSNGLVFGVEKDLGVKNYMFVARLLSGGYSSVDKDNEWDQYIVNSTLNGNIIAGDDRVWNWSAGYSSTSTTNANSANRVRRGVTTASTFGAIASATANGYRPLVELETLPMFKSFVKHDGAYKRLDTGTLEWNTISATLPSEDTFINEGMDDLFVLDRKNEVCIQTMNANGSLGSGKTFKASIDLKKYFEITSVSVK